MEQKKKLLKKQEHCQQIMDATMELMSLEKCMDVVLYHEEILNDPAPSLFYATTPFVDSSTFCQNAIHQARMMNAAVVKLAKKEEYEMCQMIKELTQDYFRQQQYATSLCLERDEINRANHKLEQIEMLMNEWVQKQLNEL